MWTPYAAQGVREAGSLEVGSGWFSFLRCSLCLNKHVRITGVITRAIIRSTITAMRDIPTSLLNTAREKLTQLYSLQTFTVTGL